MKNYVPIWKMFFLAMLCVILISSCTKKEDNARISDPGGSNPGGSNPATTANADSLSNRLLFFSSTKKQGDAPQGGAGSNALKISFKDTLYLVDQVLQPIKFLHSDITKDVAGVFLQVQVPGPVNATYYYDVPEVPDDVPSETVSIILIGINPSGLALPVTFNMKIIPYDINRNPIAEDIRPVKIVKHKTEAAGDCGLVLAPDEYWDWDFTIRGNALNNFTSDPDKIFGQGGQMINGSCCAGISVYGICPGETKTNSTLHFKTFYQIASETLSFLDNGTFSRVTVENGANPFPAESDFCTIGDGKVEDYSHHTEYTGNYTVTPATLPSDLPFNDNQRLSLLTSASIPPASGFGNPGGIIHQLDCETGILVLIQIDLEGAKQHLYKYYSRRSPTHSERWFNFPK